MERVNQRNKLQIHSMTTKSNEYNNITMLRWFFKKPMTTENNG